VIVKFNMDVELQMQIYFYLEFIIYTLDFFHV